LCIYAIYLLGISIISTQIFSLEFNHYWIYQLLGALLYEEALMAGKNYVCKFLLIFVIVAILCVLLFLTCFGAPAGDCDYVDNNESNVDTILGKGSHSDFTAQQDGPDGIFDTLTEVETSRGSSDLYVDSFDDTRTEWMREGSSPYLDTQNSSTGILWFNGSSVGAVGDFGFQNGGLSEAIISVSLRVCAWKNDSRDTLRVRIWGSNSWSGPFSITRISPGWIEFDVTGRINTWAGVDDTEIYFDGSIHPLSEGRLFVDCAMLRVEYVTFELDLEIQWTNVTYNQHKELCIFGGTQSSENILLAAWSGSNWENLFYDLSNGWNNISVGNYIFDSTFTVRLKDGIETDDSLQNSWEVDCALLVGSSQLPSAFDWIQILPYIIPAAAIGSIILGVTFKKKSSNRTHDKREDIGFFNEMTDGGIPDSFSVMISGEAGSGKSVMCQQLTNTFLNEGKACIYITYDSFPNEIRDNMKSLSWEISDYEKAGKLTFIDSFSAMAKVKSEEKNSVARPFSLADIGLTISDVTGKVGNPRVFLDSIGPLLTYVDSSKVVEFLQDRSARIKGAQGVFLFSVGKETMNRSLTKRLEQMVDCVIELGTNEENATRRIRIKKMRGRNTSAKWKHFEIDSTRGIIFLV
jgi:KaiC/GvpD/RAD55 family RecA-like ATPase